MDVSEDGALSLLTGAGEAKDDLNLPDGTDESKALAKQIQEMFAEGKGILVREDAGVESAPILGSCLTSDSCVVGAKRCHSKMDSSQAILLIVMQSNFSRHLSINFSGLAEQGSVCIR